MQPVILYVEDDTLSRKVMNDFLKRRLGYQYITIFEDSEDFVEKLEMLSPVPDIIFLDIHMQPLDGFEMLQQIRQNPLFHATRVVALTASVMNEEVKLLQQKGFDGVFAKPLDVDAFPKVLQRILDGEQVWIIK
jgi:CheY-like chemotaxis protein